MVENVANVVFGPLSTKFQSLRRRMDIYCTYMLVLHVLSFILKNMAPQTEKRQKQSLKRGKSQSLNVVKQYD